MIFPELVSKTAGWCWRFSD